MTVVVLTILCSSAAVAARPRDRISPAREHVVRVLDRGLAATPMRGTGRRLEQIAHQWHVSPFFIIGASGRESSVGAHPCGGNPRNIWGLNSCVLGRYIDLDGDGVKEQLPVLRSWGHAYTWFARYIVVRWSHARIAQDFNAGDYCRCSGWGDSAALWMRRLFGVASTVRYP